MPWPGILTPLFDVLDRIGMHGAELWNIWSSVTYQMSFVISNSECMYYLKVIPLDCNML